MINIIEILLPKEKYKLIKSDKTIILFKGNSDTYPEDYIEIERATDTDKFVVSEVHRDKKQIKVQTEKEEEAIIYAVVIYKRLYDDIVDRTKARRIRTLLDAGEEKKALDGIVNSFDVSLFSINHEDGLKISLIHSENKVDVKFGGEYLAESATLSRGYVVLYNYCEKLKHISLFYKEICNKLDCAINRENILKMYILGK